MKSFTEWNPLEVNARIQQPTQWCAGMVAVPKRNGSVSMYLRTSEELHMAMGHTAQEETFTAVKQGLAILTEYWDCMIEILILRG